VVVRGKKVEGPVPGFGGVGGFGGDLEEGLDCWEAV
jgi:hypothetical protein